jgi:hypothetical protein
LWNYNTYKLPYHQCISPSTSSLSGFIHIIGLCYRGVKFHDSSCGCLRQAQDCGTVARQPAATGADQLKFLDDSDHPAKWISASKTWWTYNQSEIHWQHLHMAECDNPFHLSDVTSPSTFEGTSPNSGQCFLTGLADREDLADPFGPGTVSVPSGCQSFRSETQSCLWSWGTLPAISTAVAAEACEARDKKLPSDPVKLCLEQCVVVAKVPQPNVVEFGPSAE